ncbi:MFS transporter [Tomitella gaofuii]|uniref:MFS transporter n=1 Tax=Tomitella gaofuii TaxID=2760083 RepID=UPI0015FA345A|nr:aromatic acid/H+ symport family MFS transporter [Tomitella gaofuii]
MKPLRHMTWPAMLCWLTVLLEGYDLVALGAGSIALENSALDVTAERLTVIATVSLVGVMIGAAFVTPMADRIGRRRILIASVASFSLFTILLPLSPNYEVFTLLRLLAGLGLGACMPVSLAVASESRPPSRRARASTTTMTGYHGGAVLASLFALSLGAAWEALFIIGGALGLLLAAVMWFKLPETLASPAGDAATVGEARVGVRDLLRPRFLRTTLAVWVATFMGLLLVYGLNTWMPKLMKTAGYDVSTSLTLLFVLNAGGILGMVLAGRLGDTKGISRTTVTWFGVGAVLLAVLSIRMSHAVVLDVVIFLTGVFVFSAQVLVYAYVAREYPDAIRASALGIASGVGRLGAIVGPLITGVMVTAGVAHPWGFYFFAGAAVLGLVAMLVAPWSRSSAAAPADLAPVLDDAPRTAPAVTP